MNKVFVVSVVVAACVFAANAGAKEGKSGFYLTGKAGASVVSLQTSVSCQEMRKKHQSIKAAMTMIRYSVAVLRPVMIFIRSSVFRFVQNWSFTLVEKLIRSIT
ncbi:tia invasion determinant [Escherichia coli]|uniref:Tia invasion determinant n=1 Tax=Escherichia coli TaxID=562 RepID=A0A376YGV9_ECOLX|nr:tia invasion determinant [Escherichia coli]